MWFLLGLLIGLTFHVEPATVAAMEPRPDMPLWLQIAVWVFAIAVGVPLVIVSFRFGVFGGFAAERETRAIAERNMLAAQREYYRDIVAAKGQNPIGGGAKLGS